MEKGLDIPLAERLSLFSLSLFSLRTHTNTHTLTFIYLYIGCEECKTVWTQKNAPLNGDHCPSFGLVCELYAQLSGCNIIFLYREIFVLNVRNWFHLFDLNGIKCWVHFNNNVAFYSASLRKKTGMFLDFVIFFFLPLLWCVVGWLGPHCTVLTAG